MQIFSEEWNNKEISTSDDLFCLPASLVCALHLFDVNLKYSEAIILFKTFHIFQHYTDLLHIITLQTKILSTAVWKTCFSTWNFFFKFFTSKLYNFLYIIYIVTKFFFFRSFCSFLFNILSTSSKNTVIGTQHCQTI